MWSKKGIFVVIWLWPLPSMPRSIWILVSLVRRSIWAWRLVMGLFGLLGLALLYLQENVRPGKYDHEAHHNRDRPGQLHVKGPVVFLLLLHRSTLHRCRRRRWARRARFW